MFSQTITGIIIKITNFQEADKIVTVFSKELGKTQFIAKGVRRMKSKTSGVVDHFIEANFEITNKSQLPLLIQANLISWFSYLRSSLAHWQYAERAGKALLKATTDHDPHPELYFLFKDFLEQGKVAPNPQWWWLHFLWQLLFLTGFGINITHCFQCAAPLSVETVGTRMPTYEGFRCTSCSLKQEPTDQALLATLQALEKNSDVYLSDLMPTQSYLEEAYRYHFL